MFIHGDLQIVHVFVDGDELSGVVDWSEGAVRKLGHSQDARSVRLATDLYFARLPDEELLRGVGGVNISERMGHPREWGVRTDLRQPGAA